MENLPSLLYEFDQRLGKSVSSVSEFVAENDDNISSEWLVELIGVFAEHQFRNGDFGWFEDLEQDFPNLEKRRIDEVIAGALSNFISSYCPATDILGELPAQHGEFLFTKEIGRGGTGVIYEGRHTRLNRALAIKVPFASNSRIQSEGKTLSRLDHPNIASIYHYGDVGHLQFIAMQMVAGKELKSYCRNPPSLKPEKVVEILIQTLDAIDACHARGIVHLDLSPRNILLANDRPIIIDFGLATSVANTEIGMMGSPSYMAPEMLRNSEIDSPILCDVFSLGVVLYELLTGSKPYGKDLASMQFPARRCSDYQPEIDPELDRICLKAISIDPGKRFPTARNFQNSLKLYRDSKNQSPAPVNGQQKTTHKHDTTSPKPVFPVLKWAGIGLFLMSAAALPLALSSVFGGPPSDSYDMTSDSANTLPTNPQWTINCYRENVVDNDIVPVGQIGYSDIVIRQDDYLSIQVKLAKPSLCYLIAANPDSSLQFLYQSKGKVQELAFPDKSLFFKLNEGAGLQAFTLLLSQEPIPQWNNWVKDAPQDTGWDGASSMSGVWRMDHQEICLLRAPVAERGDIVMKNIDNSLARLDSWLDEQIDASIHSVSFPIKP